MPTTHKRLLFSSLLSICLALALAWVGAGLPRPEGPRIVFASGTTRYVASTGVDTLNDCSVVILPCLTVQHAADQSAPGDEIRIAGGTYSGVSVRETVTQVVYISQSLTLRGGYTTTDSFATSDPNLNPTILDAQLNNARVLFITGTSVTSDIENLTLQNGKIDGSGSDCPDAGCGGGLFVNGTLSLTNVTVMSSTAHIYGGGAWVVGAAILSSGVFQNNTASPSPIGGGRGGGLYALSTLTLTGTRFISNTARPFGGGGLWVNGAATLYGGLFEDNSASAGGGLWANSTLTLTGTQFLSNTALGGGGMYANSAATLDGGLFQKNTAESGGGLWANSMLTLTGTQFLSNAAYYTGGGAATFGVATLNGGLFQNNVAVYGGGGGGLTANSTLALTGTQFLSNTGASGGGLRLAAGSGRIVNALFTRNVATTTLGAALSLSSTGTVQILHTTIASPILAGNSAIFISAGTVGISDTIVSSYTIGISSTGSSTYENYNLFFGNGTPHIGTTGGTNDVLSSDPRFIDPLSDNYRLRVGSPAIDRGANAGVTTDFEGDVRPFGAGYDIGYDEWIGKLLYLPLVRR